MRGKKIIIVLIIINIILIGVVCSFIKKEYLNNKKIIVKALTEKEYEDNITSLNTSYEDYTNYIEESKKKIASAITDMGVETSNEDNLETMANNIRNLKTSGIKYWVSDTASYSGMNVCTTLDIYIADEIPYYKELTSDDFIPFIMQMHAQSTTTLTGIKTTRPTVTYSSEDGHLIVNCDRYAIEGLFLGANQIGVLLTK